MLRASVVPVVVLGAALSLSGCGGGGGGPSAAGTTSSGTGSSVAGSVGTSVGTSTGTGAGANTGTKTGTNTGSGSTDGSTAHTGTDSGSNVSPGSVSSPDTGTGGTGAGTDTGSGTSADTGSHTGGTSTSDAACPDISRCVDFTAVRIAKYLDNKQAAASYTFDDGYPSSTTIGSIFEKAGLRATFYIIPGVIADDGWSMWQALASKGHEIGNHSMTHPDFVNTPMTDQQLDTEINGAQKLIEQKLGIRTQTFAFPYHLYTDRALTVAQQNHFAVRKMNLDEPGYQFAFFDTDHGTDLAGTLVTVNQQLDEVVKAGGWFVAGGHGVDGDGWSPVTTDFLQKHLAYAGQYSPKLWIDTFANVSRYRLCRDVVKPDVLISSTTQAYVQLTGSYDPALCNAPLTVTLPVSLPSGSILRAKKLDGTEVSTTVNGGTALFRLRPGDKVSLQVAQAVK